MYIYIYIHTHAYGDFKIFSWPYYVRRIAIISRLSKVHRVHNGVYLITVFILSNVGDRTQ